MPAIGANTTGGQTGYCPMCSTSARAPAGAATVSNEVPTEVSNEVSTGCRRGAHQLIVPALQVPPCPR